MDADEIRKLLRKRQGKRTQREFAQEMKISQAYLSDIYRGKREPGELVMKFLGLRRTVSYGR